VNKKVLATFRPMHPVQRGKRQILSLRFWNFLNNIKIIDKKLIIAEKYKNIRFLKLRHPKIGIDIFLIFCTLHI
jgi:hypothetical protein